MNNNFGNGNLFESKLNKCTATFHKINLGYVVNLEIKRNRREKATEKAKKSYLNNLAPLSENIPPIGDGNK